MQPHEPRPAQNQDASKDDECDKQEMQDDGGVGEKTVDHESHPLGCSGHAARNTQAIAGAIGTWKSPVLLLGGDADRHVAFAQTTGLVQLLRAHGVYHELIVFRDDVHDSLLCTRWIYTFDRTADFISRYIGDGRKRPTTEGVQ
jgi:alpha-beta hydrolase superfamily lysophospholipase